MSKIVVRVSMRLLCGSVHVCRASKDAPVCRQLLWQLFCHGCDRLSTIVVELCRPVLWQFVDNGYVKMGYHKHCHPLALL